MSVSKMARLAEGDSAEPDSTLQSALRLVAAYIPSEAIALYVVVLGLLNPSLEATSEDVTIVRFRVLRGGDCGGGKPPFRNLQGRHSHAA